MVKVLSDWEYNIILCWSLT